MALLCLFALPATAQAATEGDYTYEVTNGEATITDYTGTGGDITLPATLGGYPVTTIDNWAFELCSSLTSVIIPDSVTTIGGWALLNCGSLTSVTIGDGVTTIGDGAFGGCSNLTGIWVSENNGTYSSDSNGVLFNKDETVLILVPLGISGSYNIPDGVTTIDDYAFYDCTSLTSVTIPDSVTTIGGRAFGYCDSLTDVYYSGTEAQWNEITIDSGNDDLLNATIHFTEEHTHTYTNYLSNGDATCTEDGTQTAKCDYCDAVDTKTANGSALGHSFTNYVSDGNTTCTKDGTETAICDRAGCEQTDTRTNEASTLHHSFTNYVSDNNATCTEGGTQTAKCDYCDAVDTKAANGSALGHSFTNYISDNNAHLTYDGTETAKCDRCDFTNTREVFLHSSGEILLNSATYPESEHNYPNNYDVTKTFTCKNAKSLTVTFSEKTKLENYFDDIYLYDGNGEMLYTYTGTQAAGQTVKITGDSFSIRLVTDRILNYYGYAFSSIVAEIEQAHPLTVEPAVPATCTQSGLTEGSHCEICQRVIVEQTTEDALGHNYVNGICSNCGDTLESVQITQQPVSVTVADGEKATVTVEATGEGLTYKWYFKNAGSSSYSYTSSFTGNSYYVTMNAARDGRQVMCIVTDKYGNEVESEAAILNMLNPLKITKQPESVTVAEGEQATVTVEAIGDGLTYKWYFKNAGASSYSYTSSFTGNSYSVTMNAQRDGRRVLCIIYDKYGNSVQSASAVLNMGNTVKITQQPVRVTVDEGEQATVTVTATGDGLTYRWYYKNPGESDYTHADSFTGNTYSVTMDAQSDGCRVVCIVTDKYGNEVQTDAVSLNMTKPVKITQQPVSVTVVEGEQATVTVEATGDDLSYRWYYKNPGESDYTYASSFAGNSYSVTMNAERDGCEVMCIVTDKYGNEVESDAVSLNMAKPVKITQQPVSVTVAEGKTAKVTVTATGDELSYRWYYKNVGESDYTYTSSFTSNSYYVTMNAARDGRQVMCIVTDKYGNEVESEAATLSMAKPVQITQQPESVTVAEGEQATVTVEAIGDGLTYKWYFKNAGASSYTYTSTFTGNTYSVTMSAARNGRSVLCVVYDKYGNQVKSRSAVLNMK